MKFESLYKQEKNRRSMLESYRLPKFDSVLFDNLKKEQEETQTKVMFLEKENIALKSQNSILKEKISSKFP